MEAVMTAVKKPRSDEAALRKARMLELDLTVGA